MRPPSRSTRLLILASLVGISGCGRESHPPVAPPPAVKVQLKDEIPAEHLDAVATAHLRGHGLMEQYEYHKAAEAFREVRSLAPGWTPGAVNLAIALLNDSGAQAEQSKDAGGDKPLSNFDEALGLLDGVLKTKPEDPRALFCKGIILAQQGQAAEAHPLFLKVTEIDPLDAASWLWAANTLTNAEDPSRPTGPAEAPRKIELLNKALAIDPYLASALYPLAFAYRMAGQPDKQREILERWKQLDPDRPGPVPGPGDVIETAYGEMGRYGSIVNPPRLTTIAVNVPERMAGERLGPSFDFPKPLEVELPAGCRWAKPEDFTGDKTVIDRVRRRFGAAVVPFDADGNGLTDLFLAAAIVGPKGPRDALLLNKGDGRFEDVSAAFGLPDDRASTGAAAGDFDADRRIDLYLTGLGDRLLRNKDGKTFEDITSMVKPPAPASLSLTARWLDLDQDGDLDLYIINYTTADHAEDAFTEDDKTQPPGVANSAYRNDGKPPAIAGKPEPSWTPLATADNVQTTAGLSLALVPWTGQDDLLGGIARHTGLAFADFDGDRDLDLILSSDDGPPAAVLNERLGRFRASSIKGVDPKSHLSGLLAFDVDNDGRPDLAGASLGGPLQVWRNITSQAPAASLTPTYMAMSDITGHTIHRSPIVADLDLDGRLDMLGLAESPPVLVTGRQEVNEGRNVATAHSITGSLTYSTLTTAEGKKIGPLREPTWPWLMNEDGELKGAPSAEAAAPRDALSSNDVGMALVDLAGDVLPEVLVVPYGGAPSIWRNMAGEIGHRWLSLDLSGRWRVQPELMRTNPHGIGARVVVQARGIDTVYDHTTPSASLGSAPGPVVIGLKGNPAADVVHVRWPDGVMQAELNVAADQKLELAERNRKTGSCPVLFTWNGERFVCLGDFLGGGGLGYLVAPGVYGQPDRDEAVAITDDQLKAEHGVFRLSITEPMDEVAYLDHLTLEVVDRPPGVSVALDERFAPTGTRPTGELRAWRTAVEPVRATDLNGVDQTETFKAWDRKTVDGFARLAGWTGYAEEHGIVLDFGDRLAGYGPNDRLSLCLAGWVEYPYSQTNYAAATAGVSLTPPTIERLGEDGSWQVIDSHAGYPAGLPRMTTLDLTGKLAGPRCVLRIRTNMECYYDQAFIAVRDADAEKTLRTTRLPVARAVLGSRGYTREVSPDGRLPLLYDYAHVDPAPLARMSGTLTRFGDVADLLRADDDRLCVVGPGDEARVEFAADGLPALPEGWRRSYVLRSVGYCKDADPFTAGSDDVGPLPWKGMPDYPFADPKASRPVDAGYAEYLRTYQTRPAGGPRGDSR